MDEPVVPVDVIEEGPSLFQRAQAWQIAHPPAGLAPEPNDAYAIITELLFALGGWPIMRLLALRQEMWPGYRPVVDHAKAAPVTRGERCCCDRHGACRLCPTHGGVAIAAAPDICLIAGCGCVRPCLTHEGFAGLPEHLQPSNLPASAGGPVAPQAQQEERPERPASLLERFARMTRNLCDVRGCGCETSKTIIDVEAILLRAAAVPPASAPPEVHLVESHWAMKAAAYARREVTPGYAADETPTRYERGQIQNVAAIYRDGYLAACEMFRAALVIAPPASAWRAIASAPKDGTIVLVYDEGAMFTSWFDEDEQTWMDDGPVLPPPTHWQPMPDPPARSAEA